MMLMVTLCWDVDSNFLSSEFYGITGHDVLALLHFDFPIEEDLPATTSKFDEVIKSNDYLHSRKHPLKLFSIHSRARRSASVI